MLVRRSFDVGQCFDVVSSAFSVRTLVPVTFVVPDVFWIEELDLCVYNITMCTTTRSVWGIGRDTKQHVTNTNISGECSTPSSNDATAGDMRRHSGLAGTSPQLCYRASHTNVSGECSTPSSNDATAGDMRCHWAHGVSGTSPPLCYRALRHLQYYEHLVAFYYTTSSV